MSETESQTKSEAGRREASDVERLVSHIPDGWQLVPVTPDKRMIGTAEQIIREYYDYDRIQASFCADQMWAGMLHYAPKYSG